MKILNSRRISNKIAELMEIKQASSMLNMVITNTIANNSIIPSDVGRLRKEAEYMHEQMQDFTVDHIMLLLLVEGMIDPYFGNTPELMDFFMNWLAAESKVFDKTEFNQNAYIQNIRFDNQVSGDYELRYHDSMPYEVDIYNVPKRITELCVDIPRVSCFTERFEYPCIFQKSIKETWMSVSPNEVYTMEKSIKNANGKVLTLGCGMGYFAYMASRKSDVESVTIIELEQDVIDLFEQYILPQFENKEKINVIKANAVDYLRNIEDGEYDYCFADIWIGIADIAPYFSVKEIGRKFKKTKMDYWIEDSFGILLAQYVWIEILKSFSEACNLPSAEMDMEIGDELEKRKAKYISELLKDVSITKPEHIDYYMDPKNIIVLIDNTDIIF